MRKLLAVAFAVGLAMPALAADVHEFPAPGIQASLLKIEASGDIEAIRPLIEDFQAANPAISVTYSDSLTNDLYALLQKECDARRPFADLVFSSSADHIVKLANDGCAQTHVSPETNAAPAFARWRDEVFGFTFEPAVIVYNRTLVPQADVPHSRDALADLLRNKAALYSGRIGTYDIARSGIGYLFSAHDAQQSSAYGRMLEGFGRASARLYCCSGDLLGDIASGKLLIGYNVLGSYAYGRLKAGAPIGIVLPDDYTLVLSRAAFIPAAAPNPAAGKMFLDYLLSVRGQRIAAERSFYFAFGKPAPEGVDAPDADRLPGIWRPIAIGPALLAVTDAHKRQRMLREWNEALGSQ
ncbi:MAG: ABC transporter substrate-binding protein [Rhizobiaceae bacterium]